MYVAFALLRSWARIQKTKKTISSPPQLTVIRLLVYTIQSVILCLIGSPNSNVTSAVWIIVDVYNISEGIGQSFLRLRGANVHDRS